MIEYIIGGLGLYFLFHGNKKDVVSMSNTGGCGNMGDNSIPSENIKSANIARVRQWSPIVSKYLNQTQRLKNVMDLNDVLAIIYLESKGFTNVAPVQSAGEIGLMQVTPIAWQDLYQNGLAYDYSHEDLNCNPDLQIRCGISYLDFICKKVGNDVQDIVKSYNVGYGRVLTDPNIGKEYLALWNDKLTTLKGN